MGGYELQEIVGGRSGAENYKISASGQTYMLKILPRNFDEHQAKLIPDICKLYHDLGINSLTCYKFGRLSEDGRFFCIYNYIDGRNFEELGKAGAYPEAENYDLGITVGKWLKTLKECQVPPALKLAHLDIAKLTKDANQSYQEILTHPLAMELLPKYLNIDQLNELHQRFNAASQIFDDLPQYPIHGDIKRANVMRDSAGKLYLIDIELLKYGYDMLNFRHQMTWLLRPSRKRSMLFLQGVLDGLYDHQRPVDFNEQVLYVYALNFIEYAKHTLDQPEQLKSYFELISTSLPLVLRPNDPII